MNIEDVVAALAVLAPRVRRISPPLASDPERFHEERSEIAHDIADIARRIAPRARRSTAVAVSPPHGGELR